MGRNSFPGQARLTKARDFTALHKRGKRIVTKHFVISLLSCGSAARGTGKSRFGVSINRKAGNATERNRLKRLLREFFRLNREMLQTPADIHVVLKRGVRARSLTGLLSVEEELQGLLKGKRASGFLKVMTKPI